MKWPLVQLGEICELKYGKSLPAKKREEGDFPVYGSNGVVGWHSESVTAGPTVVVGRKGSFGEVAYSSRPCWPIDTTYFIDSSVTDTDLKWLSYRLGSLGLTGLNRAAAVPGLNREDAYRQQLLLPPLDEQRRIAAILDHTSALLEKRREIVNHLASLERSIYWSMFAEKEWQQVRLTQLCSTPDDVRCGPFGTQLQKSEFVHEGVPLWGIKNVNSGFKLPAFEFLEDATAKRLNHYSIVPNDIVMTRKGTIGNCAVFPDTQASGIMHSDLLRVRLDPAKARPVFVSHQLHHDPKVTSQISTMSSGAIMPGINVGKLKGLLVIDPPLEIQLAFERRIGSLNSLRVQSYHCLDQLNTLFASLKSRAFSGQL